MGCKSVKHNFLQHGHLRRRLDKLDVCFIDRWTYQEPQFVNFKLRYMINHAWVNLDAWSTYLILPYCSTSTFLKLSYNDAYLDLVHRLSIFSTKYMSILFKPYGTILNCFYSRFFLRFFISTHQPTSHSIHLLRAAACLCSVVRRILLQWKTEAATASLRHSTGSDSRCFVTAKKYNYSINQLVKQKKKTYQSP